MNETQPPPLPPGTSSPPPTAQHVDPVQQVDPSKPFAYYRFVGDEVLLAEMIATEEDCQGFTAQREYWRFAVERTSINTLDFNIVNVKKEPGEGRTVPFSPEQVDFVCSLTPRWGGLDPESPVTCHHYDDPFGPCGFALQVRRSDVSSPWVGWIQWARPLDRHAPLFMSQSDYSLKRIIVDQGATVTNTVGTQWTPPITNYGDGDWRDPVVSTRPATGLQVIYGGDHYGIVNARLVYPDGSFSDWASDDMSGDYDPQDDPANLGHPITQVSVRTGWYLKYALGLVNLNCGGGWVTVFPTDRSYPDIQAFVPDRCAVVGIQGKKRDNYGLVDIKLAYRELPELP